MILNILIKNNNIDDNFKVSADKYLIIIININKITIYNLKKYLIKIEKILQIYDMTKDVNILFQKNINNKIKNIITTKLYDVIYKLKSKIDLYNVSDETKYLMEEIKLYKKISMDTNKTPDTYLEYINKILEPTKLDYAINLFNLKSNNNFPLTQAVGMGSIYGSYFLHVNPIINKMNKMNIFLIGKAVTYDSGGLNIKTKNYMNDMYSDMMGSALLLSVFKLLIKTKNDNHNYHLLFPIVENMISNNSYRPGSIITSKKGKKIYIENTDAEGRLCIADAVEYVNDYIENNKINPKSCLILDAATLTGACHKITESVSSIIMCNQAASKYTDQLISIGNNVGEYLDYLQLRPEYMESISSNIADIKNSATNGKHGCIEGGMFINYFNNINIPLIHIDIAPTAFENDVATGYGVNLLYEFFKKIDN